MYPNLNFKIMGIIATLIIGAIAGWLGGTIYKGSGLGLIGNIIIGILGSGVGYWLLGRIAVFIFAKVLKW